MARLHTYTDVLQDTAGRRVFGNDGFEEGVGTSWRGGTSTAEAEKDEVAQMKEKPAELYPQPVQPVRTETLKPLTQQPNQSLNSLQQRMDMVNRVRVDAGPTLPKDKRDHIQELCGCTLSNKVRALSVGRNERVARSGAQEKMQYADAVRGLQAVLREPCFVDPQKSINELVRNEVQNKNSAFVRKLMGAECQALNIQEALKRVQRNPVPSADGVFGDWERIATAYIQAQTGKTVDGAFGPEAQAGLRHMAENNRMCGVHVAERMEVGKCGPEVTEAVQRPLLSALAEWHVGEFARMNMNTVEIGKTVPVTLTLLEARKAMRNGTVIDKNILDRAQGERIDLTGPNMTSMLKFNDQKSAELFKQAIHEASKDAPSEGDVHGQDTKYSDELHAKESQRNVSTLVKQAIEGNLVLNDDRGRPHAIKVQVLPDFERHDYRKVPELTYMSALTQAVGAARRAGPPEGMTRKDFENQLGIFEVQMKNESTRPTVMLMPLLRQVDHGEIQPDWVQRHALDPVLGEKNVVDQVLNVQTGFLQGIATFAKETVLGIVAPDQAQWEYRSNKRGETNKYNNFASDPIRTDTITSHGMEPMEKDPTMQREGMKITLRDNMGNPVMNMINFADKGIAAGLLQCDCNNLPRGTVLYVDVDMANGRTKDGGLNPEKLGEVAKHLLDFSVVKPAEMTKEDFDQLTQNGVLPRTRPDGQPLTLEYVQKNAQVLCNAGVVHPLTFLEHGDAMMGSLLLGSTLYFALRAPGGGSVPCKATGGVNNGGLIGHD